MHNLLLYQLPEQEDQVELRRPSHERKADWHMATKHLVSPDPHATKRKHYNTPDLSKNVILPNGLMLRANIPALPLNEIADQPAIPPAPSSSMAPIFSYVRDLKNHLNFLI